MNGANDPEFDPAALDARAAAMEAAADHCAARAPGVGVRELYESAAAFTQRAACERDRRASWDARPRDANGEPY